MKFVLSFIIVPALLALLFWHWGLFPVQSYAFIRSGPDDLTDEQMSYGMYIVVYGFLILTFVSFPLYAWLKKISD